MGFKGVQPLQRVNYSNMLAVLTVMSNILGTSLIRGKLGCDDDDATRCGFLSIYCYILIIQLFNANI